MSQTPEPRRSGNSGQGFFGDIIGDLREIIGSLLRQEISLARTEMTQNAKKLGMDAGFLAIGGAVAYGGFLVILAAVVNALAGLLPRWLAAGLVGLVAVGVGGALMEKGRRNLQQEDVMPERTIDSVKAGASSVKDQVV